MSSTTAAGLRFEQYVLRAPKAAMTVVLDDEDRVLLMWRHRFVIDRWMWELPCGYVDDGEDPAMAAVREVEEETGWRPRSVEPLVSFQPMVGAADAENDALDLIARGEIVGSGTVVGLLHLLAARQRDRKE